MIGTLDSKLNMRCQYIDELFKRLPKNLKHSHHEIKNKIRLHVFDTDNT